MHGERPQRKSFRRRGKPSQDKANPSGELINRDRLLTSSQVKEILQSATASRTAGANEDIHFEHVQPWKHVTVWLVGVVIASLTPLLWTYISSSPRNTSPNIYQILGKGDLYLISVVVLIAGITEIILLTKRIRQDLTVALLIIGGFLFVIVDAAKYAGASEFIGGSIAPHSVAYWSIAAFAVSAIHSSVCVWLAAGVR
jgi:energy-converting hydrogenase Eha subunit C